MNKPIGIQFDHITFTYAQKPVLKEVSFIAAQGEITALFGPSGAGKSTCLRIIAGLETPQSGQLHLGNHTISPSNPIPPYQRNLGFCFQEPALWAELQVDYHIDLPLRTQSFSTTERHSKVEKILTDFGLTHLARRKPSELSGGEQKRLSFARALATDPAILLLDEPLSSVEKKRRDEMIQLIRNVKKAKRTIILVTHHWEEVEALADRIVVIMDGQIHQSGTYAQVYQHPQSRPVAELMGYSYFFPVWQHGYKRITPHGEWIADPSSPISWGTIANQAIECLPHPQGPFIVQDSRWLGDQYRIELRNQEQCIVVKSKHAWHPGESATIRLKEIPRWIKD